MKTSTAHIMASNLDTQALDALADEIKNTNRRLDVVIKNQDEQRKSIDILNGDRDILESIITLQRELKSILEFFKNNQKQDNKEMQLGLGEVKATLDNTIPKVEEKVLQNLDQAIDIITKKKNIDFNNKSKLWYKQLWAFLTFQKHRH